ncbi:FxSxx-COOH system tetratricopeptide repeat protein [Actinomadura sp. 7K534]|uniref:FxSxx-COOH system tetratricopeptide repeat protein n=1 Tax=Actinomadura sp. 7K534 TaxID=2530366 RepID=UPI0010498898|nr:FxSxx-COOH system tetratricopeptide repeat protein [Actinomadura sp. 7K534]TDB94205.1 tetratricopeptide repeat protein [Actinomadura sp. 7K534]
MAAGGDIIDSSTHVGDVYQAASLPRPEDVDPPARVPPVLPLRTATFVGRDGKLAELDDALATPGGAVVQAVHGLGGVGKSALAAQWAYQHADAHDLTWWVTADSAAGVTAGLADLAGMLVPEMTRSAPAAVGQEERAAWARRWLATHTGWLVVLDNVTHPADVAELVTGAPGGRFLITSRLREGWYDLVPALIELDVLSASEAEELLARILTTGRPADLTGAAELCAELGHLPLAVKQAGAYMRQTHLSPTAYLGLLRTEPAVMYDRAARGADGERTIARIWRLTLDHLAADGSLAGDVLRVLAWWAPEGIPRGLLAPLGGPADLATALGDLSAYNMINLDADTIALHRLVQAVARTPDPRPVQDDGDPHRRPDDIDRARTEATDLLNQAIPTTVEDPAQWPTWQILAPHVTALAERTGPDTDTIAMARVLSGTGCFLLGQGALNRAITYFRRALAGRERMLGGDHRDTLESRSNLASAYQAAGDLGRAIPLFEAALTDCERTLDNDHPDVLMFRNNLALAYQVAGDLRRAVPLYRRILDDCERLLGPDHHRSLTYRNNLASGYEAAGDVGRAVRLYEVTLADRRRVLGDDHPDTLASRNNLASAYQAAGDLGRAIPLLEATLADCERVLGDDHPDTLGSRNNLAHAYVVAGDAGRAIPLLEATVADRARLLGDDHPGTLASRNNLAAAYAAASDPVRAVRLYKATLADRERVLGADHPHTLASRNNLAHAYAMAGNPGRALPLFQRVLADSERVLGAEHPTTETVRANLAAVRRMSGPGIPRPDR